MFASTEYQQTLLKVNALVNHPELQTKVRSTEFISGVIFAASVCPEIPLPTEWLPLLVCGDLSAASSTQVDQFSDTCFELFRVQVSDLQKKQIGYPSSCVVVEEMTKKSALAQWCMGVITQHKQSESSWQTAWDCYANSELYCTNNHQQELTRFIKLMTMFADVPMALKQREAEQQQQLLNHLPLLYKSLPATLQQYIDIADSLSGALPTNVEFFSS